MRKQTKLVAVLSAAALFAIGASMTSFAAGWAQEDGSWVYLDRDGDRVTEEWKKSGSNYYLDCYIIFLQIVAHHFPKGCFLWGILFPCHKINLQTGKSILHQFEGLFYGKEKRYPTKSSPSGNDGQLSKREQCKGQGRN